jgi:hypothetical protein
MRRMNQIASGLLGVLLIGVGLLVALEVALVSLRRNPVWLPLGQWYQRLSATTLADRAVLATAIVVGLAGVAILVLELRRWAPDRLLAGGGAGAPWWVSRRSVERRTATAAAATGRVARAHAEVRGRPRHWRIRVRADGWPDQREAVQAAVRTELDRLNVSADTVVEVALRRPQRRVA